MKGRLRKKILAVLMIFSISLLFTSGAEKDDLIENLVGRRVEIMNAFFSSEISKQEASDALKKVETGRLLEEDLQTFQTFFRTDIDQIASYYVTVPKITYRDDEVITALVQVVWKTKSISDCEDAETFCSFSEYYSVILQKCENSYKIAQFF